MPAFEEGGPLLIAIVMVGIVWLAFALPKDRKGKHRNPGPDKPGT